ncbi:DUF2889 domain-containing protein [Geomonas sp.]|uniref:DUF2889 domain-containing protein n=1 Tax=Geomonas sp. TaxID=2651584 RepID=UPI002B46FAC4|nr:DUF2889 domain-containing protein [Geomonas sp.]HJV35876.1 DUF2889 domain-containing protein [Geomonas sp.]
MSQLNTMEDFQRDISYKLLKRSDKEATLTALMRDRFHDVELNITVNPETMEILAAGVEFRKCPTTDCQNVHARLSGLVGFTIGKGLNKKIIEVMGGGEGCGNLRNLLLGLLPLALNLRAAAGIKDEREMLDTIHEQLRGSCAGYANPVPTR